MKTHSIPVVSERGVARRKAARSRRLLVVLALSLGLTLALVWLLGAGLPVARAVNRRHAEGIDDPACTRVHCARLRDAPPGRERASTNRYVHVIVMQPGDGCVCAPR